MGTGQPSRGGGGRDTQGRGVFGARATVFAIGGGSAPSLATEVDMAYGGQIAGSWQALGQLLGRLLLVAIFVHEGATLIGGYTSAAAYMQGFGVPGVLLPAVIALQLGGGLLIAVGAMTRLAALALAVFCILTAVLFHWNFAVRGELLHFEKDLAIAGGFLLLAACGPGRWSWDQRRSQ
jgi:putative oxidoreductase